MVLMNLTTNAPNHNNSSTKRPVVSNRASLATNIVVLVFVLAVIVFSICLIIFLIKKRKKEREKQAIELTDLQQHEQMSSIDLEEENVVYD